MKTPSITCPKCKRKSTLADDIKHRFCGKCGYHDALGNTAPGVPGVSAKFRQPTPLMQLQAEIAALEGHFYVWTDGHISDAERFKLYAKRFFENVQELQPYLRHGAWAAPGSAPPAGGGPL
jgi:ribosomal protein S27AE